MKLMRNLGQLRNVHKTVFSIHLLFKSLQFQFQIYKVYKCKQQVYKKITNSAIIFPRHILVVNRENNTFLDFSTNQLHFPTQKNGIRLCSRFYTNHVKLPLSQNNILICIKEICCVHYVKSFLLNLKVIHQFINFVLLLKRKCFYFPRFCILLKKFYLFVNKSEHPVAKLNIRYLWSHNHK